MSERSLADVARGIEASLDALIVETNRRPYRIAHNAAVIASGLAPLCATLTEHLGGGWSLNGLREIASGAVSLAEAIEAEVERRAKGAE